MGVFSSALQPVRDRSDDVTGLEHQRRGRVGSSKKEEKPKKAMRRVVAQKRHTGSDKSAAVSCRRCCVKDEMI